MSMSFWIRDLAERMKRTLKFTHPIQTMNDSQICDYMTTGIDKIDFSSFLSKNTIIEEFQSDEE